MDGRHPLGTVEQLWRYPVKALAPQPLERARVVPSGFEGDRQTALFVGSEGHARSGKTYRGKEHELLHTLDSTERAVAAAEERRVTIAPQGGGPYFDAGAVSIVFDTWLDDLAALLGERLHPQRFRPNLYAIAAPGFRSTEGELVGTAIAAGEVLLDVVATIKRCVTITYDLENGISDARIARVIAQKRENTMGVYCTVREAGTIPRGATLFPGS